MCRCWLVILPGSPVTTVTGLLRVFIVDTVVSFSNLVSVALVWSRILMFSLCLGKFLWSYRYYRHMTLNFCMSILKPAWPFFHKTIEVCCSKAYYSIDLCTIQGIHVPLNSIKNRMQEAPLTVHHHSEDKYSFASVFTSVKWEE